MLKHFNSAHVSMGWRSIPEGRHGDNFEIGWKRITLESSSDEFVNHL